ncbi:MAG: DNA polymerase III subunit delta [Candidatus Bipolaricaulota bacterium]|nr:DNA polymerase III subunit delta [Candidatus Bipolaricaulota bacterium]
MTKRSQNAFAFVGDAYLRERAARKLMAHLQQERPRALLPLEGRELTGAQFTEHFRGASLFDDAKILYVRRADEIPDPERLAEQIASGLPESVVLILDAEKLDKRSKLYKTLSAHGSVEEFLKPDRRSLPTLVRELLAEHHVKLTPSAIKYLLTAVEPEPGRIAKEIEKLACYSTDRELDVPQVRELLFSDQSESVLKFLDLVGERSPQSVKSLRQLLRSGEDPNKIFFMLASQIRGLLAVKSLAAQKKSSEEIAQELGRFVWLVGKQRAMAQKFSEDELIALIHRLHEEDVNIKTGERAPEESLFDLVLAMCNPTRSRL